MLDQSSALFTLMNAAASLLPIPSEDEVDQASSLTSTGCRKAEVSCDIDSEDENSQTSSLCTLTTSQSFAPTPRKKSAPLPLILMELLCDPSQSDVLSFLPEGRAFAIFRPRAFVVGHMRRLFHCAKFPTFIKKLERWGFRQVDDGPSGAMAFTHPLFRMGDWESCRKIRCGKKADIKPDDKTTDELISRVYSPCLSSTSPNGVCNIVPRYQCRKETVETALPLRQALNSDVLALAAAKAAESEARLRKLVHQRQHVQRQHEEQQRRMHQQCAALATETMHESRRQHTNTAETNEPSFPRSAGVGLSHAEVGLATKAILGAAMDVLARDGSCRRPSPIPAPETAPGPGSQIVVAESFAIPPKAAQRISSQISALDWEGSAALSPPATALAALHAERRDILRMEAELLATRKMEAELMARCRSMATIL